MRTKVLAFLLLLLPCQYLCAQVMEPAQEPPQIEDALPADLADAADEQDDSSADAQRDEPGEPEVILEPPGATPAEAAQHSDSAPSATADEADDSDAPGRVARLSLIQGEVSIAPAGSEELSEAVLNRPLTSGDRVLVDSDSRAELQVGNATLYIDGDSGLSFIELSDGALRVSLTKGTAVIRIRRRQDEEIFEVATPNAVIELLRPGEYSIVADPSGTRSTVGVRSGEAEVANDRDGFRLRAKQRGQFSGTDKLKALISELGERSQFEAFANERERRDLESRSAAYVSRDVIGYEDLDEEGDWIEEPEYGHVWRPRHRDASWVPYRDGRWAFIAPWGWTWIDHARWGFAPFHYGRWAYLHRRWCWVPGPRHYRPVYAPALVGWIGRGTFRTSVALGSGIGWFPLAPREFYVPPYRYSRRYARALNTSNPRGLRSSFRDYRYYSQANAVTLVERGVFIGGSPIDGRFHAWDAREGRRAYHEGLPPSVAPQRSSLLAGRRVQRDDDWQHRFATVEHRFRSRLASSNAERWVRGQGAGDAGSYWQPRQRREVQSPHYAPQQRAPEEQAGRRWQDRGNDQATSRHRQDSLDRFQSQRWQYRREDQESQSGRWQDRGPDQSRSGRWQHRPSGDQPQPRRWQDTGGQHQVPRAAPQRAEGRRGGGWQPQRSPRGGGGGGNVHWQRP